MAQAKSSAKAAAQAAQSETAKDQTYDVAVIGSGPGGYVCAIRASQLGLRVALIEAAPSLGGTCLNVGCIPSKALLHASAVYAQQSHWKSMGLEAAAPRINLKAMHAYKRSNVETNTKGVEFLMRKHKIDVHAGWGRIAAPGELMVEAKKGGRGQKLRARNIVIATGSRNRALPGIKVDEKRILSSTGALALPQVPKHLLVIGAGIIGLELGSVWARLGAKVSVVEMEPRIAPGTDFALARALHKSLVRQGLAFHLKHRLAALKPTGQGLRADLVAGDAPPNAKLDAKPSERLSVSHALVAVGREPLTDGLGLQELGVAQDDGGRVVIDEGFATNVAGVYAIGDAVAGPMLAHKASEEGSALAERLAGQNSAVNYRAIPNVIYTEPELAWVGQTEEELKAAGRAYRVGSFPLSANSRARLLGASDGLVKLLSDAQSDELLGAHILAPQAGDMIGAMVLGMEFGMSAEDIARSCQAHPTVSEAVKEAALAVDGRALHI
ncbi:MAG: dihydrolipoyl dehydrogenase [Hyphomicrobiales bacterium]|nr:dihydrolipoyl dehydrogenase [Hyphomicrobiales bacterium]